MQWSGVANIMVTPFAEDGTIDIGSLRSVTTWAIDAGVSFLVPLAIMGEAHKLTDSERAIVIEAVAECAEGRVPVIAGCTGESTYVVRQRINDAVRNGASGVMVAPPRAAKSYQLQVRHYTDLAESSPVPIVIQDEPVTTGVEMAAMTLGALGELENVAAVKVEEVPSPTKVSAIRAANPSLPCFGGLGGLYMLEELDRGAQGIMTGFGYPEILVEIYNKYVDGDRDGARDVFFHKMPLIRYEAQLGVGGVSIRKTLLAERGIIATDVVRQPASTGDPRTVSELKDLVSWLGLSL